MTKNRVSGRPKISIIAAVGCKGQLGLNGKLPWESKKDMQRFKYLTMGKAIIMGRKTYESISKPLLGRQNVIMTTQDDYCAPMCNTSKDIKEAIVALSQNPWIKEIFIIGGESIYKEVMDLVDILYLTHVPYNGPADTYFPQIVGSWSRAYNETDPDGSVFEVLWRQS